MILFITRKYPPMIGGMEQLSYRLTTEIQRRRPARIIAWGGSQRWLPAVIPAFGVRALAASLAARLGGTSVELLHVGDPLLSPLGLALGRLLDVPVVTTAHGLDVTWPFRPYQAVIPAFLRRLDHVVAISEATRRECLKRRVRTDRTSVIPVGVDLPPPGPLRAEARAALRAHGLPLDGDTAWLLTVGRLVRRKGVLWFAQHALPELLRSRPATTYIVVGDGPDGPALRALASSRPDGRIVPLGKTSAEIRDLLYRASDVFVMPNLPVAGDMEGFGVVAAEAAAFGLPIVASEIEGIRDVVVPGVTGLLVPPGSADHYVDAIQRLLSEPALAAQLASSARAHAQAAFDWGAIAGRYLNLFDSLVSQRAQKAQYS